MTEARCISHTCKIACLHHISLSENHYLTSVDENCHFLVYIPLVSHYYTKQKNKIKLYALVSYEHFTLKKPLNNTPAVKLNANL